MLKHRLLMSALLIPGAIGLFALDHHFQGNAPILYWLLILLSARCVWEVAELSRAVGCRPNVLLMVTATWAIITVGWQPIWYMLHSDGFIWTQAPGVLIVLYCAIAVLLLVNGVMRFPLPETDGETQPRLGRHLATLGVELFAVTYIGVFLAITVQLRWATRATEGYLALGALMIAAKSGDIGAYTFGRLIGGPKMTPKLSPGKTWSGGVGHLVTAGLCSVGWLCWLGPMISSLWNPWSVASGAVFGVVVGFAGLIGDLAESLIKRDVGAKDAPALLPGFGGLLDLMDSLLLAGPVAYGMWHLLR